MFFNVFIKFGKTSLEKSENTLEDFKDLHRLFPIVFSWPSVLQSCLQFYWFRLFFRLMFVDVDITCKLVYITVFITFVTVCIPPGWQSRLRHILLHFLLLTACVCFPLLKLSFCSRYLLLSLYNVFFQENNNTLAFHKPGMP